MDMTYMELAGEAYGKEIGSTRLPWVSAEIKKLRKENYRTFINYLQTMCPDLKIPTELSNNRRDNEFAEAFTKGMDNCLDKMLFNGF